MKVRPTMFDKFISATRDKKNNISIYLFKLFKKINAFETEISYCVDIESKKYFFDNLIDAEKFMQIKGGK